jgi:hypothetical protein
MGIQTEIDSLKPLMLNEAPEAILRLEILFDTLINNFEGAHLTLEDNTGNIYREYYAELILKAYTHNYAKIALHYGEKEIKALTAIGSPIMGWLINIENPTLYLRLLDLGAGHTCIVTDVPKGLDSTDYNKIALNAAYLSREGLKSSEQELIRKVILISSTYLDAIFSLESIYGVSSDSNAGSQ